ncbi:hypothetical protein Verru16b_02413 [Lacunisphaera limnophila]|uniref:YdhG-like domain-containing protein n=1 Tax=Lacunisphaera limnophila TaxID=1838286 RepID=A0A1D8AWS0_9BACT|nr:DUF1801 domain-containing protein [Lacunisphaera limnophila]AOS45332.1 hypothetical protein Verru16b_02413 [Lacunisphaera limnophila]
MISKATTVDGFLNTLTDAERAIFTKLRSLLKQAHPKVTESMQYRMPTYLVGDYHLGAFNKQKHYLCLYVNPEAADPYRQELKAAGLDCGKSCIRFTKPEMLPLPLAAKIIKAAGKLAGK